MKVVIASDIHGAADYCEKLMQVIEEEQPKYVLLLGDLLYHGPRNDLPADYAPKRVIEMLNSISDKVIAVRGNCEAEVDQMVLDFPCMADYNILFDKDPKTGKQFTIFFTHGHVFGPGIHNSVDKWPQTPSMDAFVYGHTHRKVNMQRSPCSTQVLWAFQRTALTAAESTRTASLGTSSWASKSVLFTRKKMARRSIGLLALFVSLRQRFSA